MSLTRSFLGILLLAATTGCASDVPAPQRSRAPAPSPNSLTARAEPPYILHLPGIGGPLSIDRALAAGLAAAKLPDLDIYDWTAGDAGLHALTAYDRNRAQARVVAGKITTHARTHPGQPIIVTSHSGGTGIAVWALEQLPPDVHVQTLVLMESALSPTYDLSPALSHVTGHAYAFSSPYDNLVLGAGTSTFGTIDRVYTDAAGMVGFAPPAHPKVAGQYQKLVPMPYLADWMNLGNPGDHIGPMRRLFASQIVAPLLGGSPPLFVPTTRPTTTHAVR